jgi:Meiotically up-regulated gene 113
MRDLILSEIRRPASQNGGKPLGVRAFTKTTGITQSKWPGSIWTRWSDALADAGYEPIGWEAKSDSAEILKRIAEFSLQKGRLPTKPEMQLHRNADPSFPHVRTISRHFSSRSSLIAALRKIAPSEEYSGLLPLLPADTNLVIVSPRKSETEGSVYLLKSGDHYKIGRGDRLERRVKEVRIALPEALTLVHSIRTDDPPGIEAYWHRRFADRRANGEWFRLSVDDVRAFTRRTFQ